MRQKVEQRLGSGRSSRPRVPEGTRIYAVGDIHGRADLLSGLLQRIDADQTSHPCDRAIHVFLGDYLDRGPASRDVINRLIEYGQTHETICLKGNHETFALAFLEDPSTFDDWRRWGGLETLISYGLVPGGILGAEKREELAAALRQAMPPEHKLFLSTLLLSYACGDFFFVHAGVRPRVKLASQEEYDLLWIRDEFLSSDADFGKIVVHGHSPIREPDVRANRINIDTGAFATGRLTCLVIDGEDLYFI